MDFLNMTNMARIHEIEEKILSFEPEFQICFKFIRGIEFGNKSKISAQ